MAGWLTAWLPDWLNEQWTGLTDSFYGVGDVCSVSMAASAYTRVEWIVKYILCIYKLNFPQKKGKNRHHGIRPRVMVCMWNKIVIWFVRRDPGMEAFVPALPLPICFRFDNLFYISDVGNFISFYSGESKIKINFMELSNKNIFIFSPFSSVPAIGCGW